VGGVAAHSDGSGASIRRGAEATTAAVLDEAKLIEGLKAQNEASFEELVRLHGPWMLALTRRYLATEADAEDALQDAFVSVFRSIGAFAGGSRLTTWLHRVAINAALMRLRSRRRRPEVLLEEKEFDLVRRGPSKAAPPSGAEAMVRRELRDVAEASLARLPEDCRVVVRLRDGEGMELREIGRVLGIGLSTLKSRLRRGRLAVRAAVVAHMEGPRT